MKKKLILLFLTILLIGYDISAAEDENQERRLPPNSYTKANYDEIVEACENERIQDMEDILVTYPRIIEDYGSHFLSIAAGKGNLDMMKLIVEKCKQFIKSDFPSIRSALQTAANCGQHKIIEELLVSRTLDLAYPDEDGLIGALSLSIEKGHLQNVTLIFNECRKNEHLLPRMDNIIEGSAIRVRTANISKQEKEKILNFLKELSTTLNKNLWFFREKII